MERAHEIQNNLPSTSFSCSRFMLKSHVSGGFWLVRTTEGISKKHLPKNNTEVVLVDENEIEYPTVYKVHIVRAASEFESTPMEEVNAARFEPTETEDNNNELSLALSESRVHFKDVKCFDSFKIEFHGKNLDSKIPARLTKKYYELCKSQENFLHEKLNKCLDNNLAARIISETTKIADSIRASKLGSDTINLEGYEKTLERYEYLGMKVGFLRARIDKLMGVSRELKDVVVSLRNKLKDDEDKYNAVKAEITGVAKSIKKLVDEIREFEAKNERSGVGLLMLLVRRGENVIFCYY
ncbi:hypothetical protein CASFOL_019954 [Castilleja foliolosa]|uniref:Uncharacterized protein n=1 Tax=Castilleja foliolosa TaxID=1961234 RepID=A0ABD3D110_9LAMI